MKALIVIDMQAGSFSRATPRYDAKQVVDRINQLSDFFHSTGGRVIFVQHDGSREDAFLPGSDEWQLLPGLTVDSTDIFIGKTANDAFYKSELDKTLKKLHIREVFITGCATDFCVDATVRSALAHDYKVFVISDAHTTADRPHMRADKVIEHHNWLWAHMIPTEGRIRVVSTRQVLEKNLQAPGPNQTESTGPQETG